MALPVYPILSSDLVENGGSFVVEGGAAEGVHAFAADDAYPSEGGAAQPVYVVSDAQVASGRFVVTGGSRRLVKAVGRTDRLLIGGAAKPVYVLSGAALGLDYSTKVAGIFPGNLIGWWKQAEAGGVVSLDSSGHGYNGAYTGVVLGQSGIGDGLTSALYDGATSFDNIYSPALAAAFNPLEGTLAAYLKVTNAGVLTDGTVRIAAQFRADAQNYLWIDRTATNNQFQLRYTAGNTNKLVSPTSSSLGWIHLAMTWSVSADQLKAYLMGSQTGATQTGLGTWVGALASGPTLLGAASLTPTTVWSGGIAHVLLYNAALPASAIAQLASVI